MRLATVFHHQRGCNIIELEALFVALLVAHVLHPEGFVPPSRIAHSTRNEVQSFQALVAIYLHVLARHVILHLSRSFPFCCFPSLLRRGSQRALAVDVNPGRPTPAPELWAPDAIPSDATTGSIRDPPLFGFRPPFLQNLLLFLLFSNSSSSSTEILSSKTKTS